MSFYLALTSNRAKVFRNTFETLRDIPIPQASLNIDPEGVNLQAMDCSHISVAKLHFSRDFFSIYKASENVTIGIDLIVLTKLLKAMQPKDGLIWEYKGDKLTIHIDSSSRTQFFHMNLIDIMEDTLDIPPVEVDYSIQLCPKYLQKMIQSVSLVEGQNCAFTMNWDNLRISSTGDLGDTEVTLSECEVDVDKENTSKTNKEGTTYCKVVPNKSPEKGLTNSFSLEFLRHFTKASCLTKVPLTIQYKQDFPLEIRYHLPHHSTLQFFIAPKCDE
jgi:proliferating cell nuclear antigen